MTERKTIHRLLALTTSLLLLAALGGMGARARAEDGPRFDGSHAETQQFLEYWHQIQLTPEQEAVRQEALGSIPAPCCANFSAATCCCECNLARATWGLSKHLIAEEGLGAEEVRDAVQEWYRTVNPDGFTGDACFTGGCGRAIHDNGCGGMKDGQLVD
jgi:hypothetical protein